MAIKITSELLQSSRITDALRGLQLSLIQRIILLHLIHSERPSPFTELLAISGSTPESLLVNIRRLYHAGYVRRLSPRGATDPVFEFISTKANRDDVHKQTEDE